MSKPNSPQSAENARSPGHKFLLCSTAPNMMLSIDLAHSLRNGDKFRKSDSEPTVFPVRFCLQDFILLIYVIEENASFCDMPT